MTLGDVIAQYRKKKKISLSSFAKKAGLSKSYLHYLEKGTNPATGKLLKPTLEVTMACCSAMEMDVLQLFEMISPEKAADAKERLKDLENAESASDADSPQDDGPLAANIPKEVPPGIPLTTETLTAAIQERRLLILPTRVPRKGDFVYLPLREYMMAVAFTVTDAGGGMFRAEAATGANVLFSIFDLEKTVFTTRGGAADIVRKWAEEAGIYL